MDLTPDPGDFPPPYADGYDAYDIAEHALWPLVNSKWGANWLEDSVPERLFSFPRVGNFDDRALDIALTATCEFQEIPIGDADEDDFDPEIDLELVRTVTLRIQESTPDLLRDLVDLALEGASMPLEQMRDTEGRLQYRQIEASYTTAYSSDNLGNGEIVRHHSLDSIYGDPLWVTAAAGLEIVINDEGQVTTVPLETEAEPITEYVDADLNNIAAAAMILGVPKVYEYLQDLKRKSGGNAS